MDIGSFPSYISQPILQLTLSGPTANKCVFTLQQIIVSITFKCTSEQDIIDIKLIRFYPIMYM